MFPLPFVSVFDIFDCNHILEEMSCEHSFSVPTVHASNVNLRDEEEATVHDSNVTLYDEEEATVHDSNVNLYDEEETNGQKISSTFLSVEWGTSTVDETGDCGGQLGHYLCGVFSLYMLGPILLGMFFSGAGFLSAKFLTITATLTCAMVVSLSLYRDEIVNGYPSRIIILDRLFALSAVFTPFVFIGDLRQDNKIYAYVIACLCITVFVSKAAYTRMFVTSRHVEKHLHILFRLLAGIFISTVNEGDSASLYAIVVHSILIVLAKYCQTFYESYHYSIWEREGQPSLSFDLKYARGCLRSICAVALWISICLFVCADEVTITKKV